MGKEKGAEGKAPSSFSSFSGFAPSMLVPLGQLPLYVGSHVVVMTPSTSSLCTITVTATAPIVSTAPFVPPADVAPAEHSCKHHQEESPWERENACHIRGPVGFRNFFFPTPRSVICFPAATGCTIDSCPGSHSVCGFGAHEFVLSFGPFFSPVA